MKTNDKKRASLENAIVSPHLWKLIEQWSMALLIENDERIITYVNESYRDLLGINKSVKELIGQPTSIISDELRVKYATSDLQRESLLSVIENKKVVEDIIYQLKEDLILAIDFIPLMNDQKKGWYVWKIKNKGDRNVIHEAIEKRNDNYWEIIDKMELGVLEVNNNDMIVRAYPRFCEMLGYTQEELVGNYASKILVPEDLHDFIAEQNRDRTEGKTGNMNYHYEKRMVTFYGL